MTRRVDYYQARSLTLQSTIMKRRPQALLPGKISLRLPAATPTHLKMRSREEYFLAQVFLRSDTDIKEFY
jgi:hypothetical protein